MITHTVDPSPNVEIARERLLGCVRDWAYDCVARYDSAAPTDVHDQLTYTTAWAPYIRAAGDCDLLAWLKRQRDRVCDHFIETGQWHHGYWRRQEAHHGTEHFELFLGTLLRLDRRDADTQAQILEATEHIGNWVAEVPTWFDPDTGLFRSLFLGTEVVGDASGAALNMPDHLRFVNLCLLAREAGGDIRYLDFAAAYARRWADAVLGDARIPLGLLPGGALYTLEGPVEAAYRSFAGMAGRLDDDVDRAENLLASNGIGALLGLWQATGESRFVAAAERLLDVVATQVDDPDAGAAAAALRTYRRITGKCRYDAVLGAAFEAAAADTDPFTIREIGIEPQVQRPERPHGIGKRSDMPNWFEDGTPRRHNPILLAAVGTLKGDVVLATRALDLARTYFQLARETLPDGRHHGCAANTVSAVARGHGRDNHAGVVTAVLFDP